MKRLSFVPQLDSFRFFSVLLVIPFHWLPKHGIFHFASVGVGFFFVLSGYLISGNLFYLKQAIDDAEMTTPRALLQFYYRRSLRIFPLYFLVIFAMFALVPASFDGNFSWYVFYAQNILFFKIHHFDGMFSHFWSLAVEEQFYLVWPMLIFFVPWRRLNTFFIGTISASILFKIIFPLIYPNRLVSLLPICQFDAFGMGALLAFNSLSGRSSSLGKGNNRLMLFALSFVLACLARTIAGMGALYNVALSGCALMIILEAQKGFKGPFGKILDLPLLQYLGKISYGLYVFHNFVPWLWRCLNGTEDRYPLPIALFTKPYMNTPFVNLFAQTVLLLIIASLSWFLFEKPINSLKNAFVMAKLKLAPLEPIEKKTKAHPAA